MRGIWATQAECCRTLDCTQMKFDRKFAPHLKWKLNGNRKLYFLTEDKMTTAALKCYESKMEEYDEDAQQVEDIIGDVTGGIELLPNASDDLKAAQLENLKARTALINEKLENRKQALWAEWNSEFFNAFAEAFAKFKNEIISLHLNEEQLSVMHEKLENALKIMKDRLDGMWNRFKEEEEEEQEK